MPGANILCLNNSRFAVSVEWKDFQGNTGSGKAIPLTGDTGYFWFFTNTNVELVVKVLDAAAINGHFWVFYGALSNVEYTITVTDTATSEQKIYSNPSGEFGSAGDTLAFVSSVGSPPAAASDLTGGSAEPGASIAGIAPAASAKAQADSCVADATALCLAAGRFRVEVNWKDFQGKTGRGQAIGLTADTGYFWFFNSANVELVVKVLDARGVNGNFWAFYGALSNVEYEIVVIDTETGESERYTNPSGSFASAGDTKAFPVDPTELIAAVTDVGTPNGEAATGSVGPAGGSLSSKDGSVTLTIPPGAVAGTVDFTIQPITNEAPGGFGNSYQLGPEGQTFAVPVQITFRYDQELGDIDGLEVAYQDAQHFWRMADPVALDQAARTATVSTKHLSAWVGLIDYQLLPAKAKVLLGKFQSLTLAYCPVKPGTNPLKARCKPAQPDLSFMDDWRVNGLPNGSPSEGTVAEAGSYGATYSAPSTKPPVPTVLVSGHFHKFTAGGQKTTLSSEITLLGNQWVGTAWGKLSPVQTYSAVVAWSLESTTADNVSTYRPTLGPDGKGVGVVTVGFTISCSLIPPSHTLENQDGSSLIVDYRTDPPTYEVVGLKTWTAQISCPPEPRDPPFVFAAVYALGNGKVSADGSTIEGRNPVGMDLHWKFTRQ